MEVTRPFPLAIKLSSKRPNRRFLTITPPPLIPASTAAQSHSDNPSKLIQGSIITVQGQPVTGATVEFRESAVRAEVPEQIIHNLADWDLWMRILS